MTSKRTELRDETEINPIKKSYTQHFGWMELNIYDTYQNYSTLTLRRVTNG